MLKKQQQKKGGYMAEYKTHYPMVKKGKIIKMMGYLCGRTGEQNSTIDKSQVTCQQCLVKLAELEKGIK